MKVQKERILAFLDKHIILSYAVLSVFLTLVLEMLNRQSVGEGLLFPFRSPAVFFINAFVIFFTLAFSLLTSRRFFVLFTVSLLWLVAGVINFIVLQFRMTPFSAIDILLVPTLLQMLDNLSPWLILLMIGTIIGVLLLIVFAWKKLPKDHRLRNRFAVLGCLVLLFLTLRVTLDMGIEAKALSDDFTNLGTAYEDYGFAYCFSNSIVDVGINKPADYSEESMQALMQPLPPLSGESQTPASTPVTKERPNVIVMQLESFFDPYRLSSLNFSEDPIPTFHALQESYSTGHVTVPCIGAGTANTEFEILTGMSTSCFGAGEYPYKTVLTSTPTEALPHVLRRSGYVSTAIHNHKATFYNRNEVFSSLGFDRFISVEYMYDISRTPNKWAKDDVLTDEIEKALLASAGPDFIFTITVQSHGVYPTSSVLEDPVIQVSKDGLTEEECSELWPVSYYVNEIREVDQMLADLIALLEERQEPTVLVLYGDHLPALSMETEEMEEANLYQTEYVIWDNIGLPKEDADYSAEQLSSVLLSRLQLPGGLLAAFHHSYDNAPDYMEKLEMLEYDLLYGEQYAEKEAARQMGSSFPLWEQTSIALGIDPICIEQATSEGDHTLIIGGQFNRYSKVYRNGKRLRTQFINEHTLEVSRALEVGDQIFVGQTTGDGTLLSSSNILVIPKNQGRSNNGEVPLQ